MHYQQDATVFWPYGTYRPREKPVRIGYNYAAGKKRKVIWVVSRCGTLFQHREHYVAEVRTFENNFFIIAHKAKRACLLFHLP